MSTIPTSSLTFRDLLSETARVAGYPYYGEDGDEELQPPVNVHDLAETKRHVNNAIRMFLKDSPPSGWSFMRPIAEVSTWGDISTDTSNKVSSTGYDPASGLTTLTAVSDSFYESMEGHSITLTGVDSFTIKKYVDAKTIKVIGDATGAGASGVTWSMTADGNYTLPSNFGGQYEGLITYSAGSDQAIRLSWDSEATIRRWRENVTDESGDPWLAAVRVMSNNFDTRRRWELLLYPLPDEVDTLLFPYILSFDKLVDQDEHPPVPFLHDDTLLAACRAIVERDVDKALGPDWQYYQTALRKSHEIDARNAPKNLGYVGDPGMVSGDGRNIQMYRNNIYNRPNVTFNS